jgi:hypothetical protein
LKTISVSGYQSAVKPGRSNAVQAAMLRLKEPAIFLGGAK